ncbi:MAG: transposase [Phycisphaerales bacterium]|nr:transposase [Phycisphaerales bacterium]
MRTKGTPAELEARRLRAAELLGRGKGTGEVAGLIGVTPSCVSKWKKALRKRGVEGLRAKPLPGRKPRLSAAQRRRLAAAIKRGAAAAGYDGDLWTCRRVRDLIGKTFGVWYDLNHVGRILHALGFSVQKPEARARERDEKAIANWRKHDWPRIKETRGG